MTFWKSTVFKELQAEWQKRLEADGFRDIEKMCGAQMELRQFANHSFMANLTREEMQDRETYFNKIVDYINATKFRNEVERLILQWHADGKRLIDIQADLIAAGYYRCKNAVRFTIRRYEMRWGLRAYSPSQLNKYR